MAFEPGLVGEFTTVVLESDTARASGGETFPTVLSTPRMISYMERASHNTILPFLNEGQGSVGTMVNIHHLAATPVGMQIRFRAEVVAVEGRRVSFKVEAWDAVEKIGEGEHERFIIDWARYNDRLEKKRQQMSKPA